MSYSSTAHLFYGFIPELLDDEAVELGMVGEVDKNCELIGLGDARCGDGYHFGIALRKLSFSYNEFDKVNRLTTEFKIPENADKLIEEYCRNLGVEGKITPGWYLGVSTS